MANLFNSCPEGFVWDPITESCIKTDLLRNFSGPTAKYTGKYPKLFYKGQEFRKKANQYLKDFDTGKRIKHLSRDEEKSLLRNLKRDKRVYKKDFKNLEKIDKIGSFFLDKIDEEKYGKYTDSSGKEKTLNPYSILSTPQGYYALKDARKKGTLSSKAWRNYVSDYGKHFNPNFKKFTKKQMKDWRKNYISDATNFTNQVAKLIHYGVLPAVGAGAGWSSLFNAPTTATLSGTFRNLSTPSLRNILTKNITTRGKNFWDATKTGFNTPIVPGTVLTPNHLATLGFGTAGAMNLGNPNSESRKNLQEAIDNPTAENIAKATATTGIDILNMGMAGGANALSNLTGPLDDLIKFGANKFDDLGYEAIGKLNPAFSQMLRNKNITPTKLGLTGGLGAAFASSDEDTQKALTAGLPIIVSGKTFPVSPLKNPKYPISDKFVKSIFGAMGKYPSSKAPEISKKIVEDYGPQFGGLVYGEEFASWQERIANQHLANFFAKYTGAGEKQIIRDVANIYQGSGVGRRAVKTQLEKMAFLDAMRSRPEVFNRILLDQQYGRQGTFLDLADAYGKAKNWQDFEKKLGKELASSFAGMGQSVKGQTRFDLFREFVKQNQLNKGLPLNQKEATAIYGYQGLADSAINSLLRGSPLTASTSMGKKVPIEGSIGEAIKNFVPKLTTNLKSAIGKQPPLQQTRSFLRGEKGDYPVEVMTALGKKTYKNLSDVDPGDVILKQDFTSTELLPKNFLQTSPRNLYEAPYQASFGPISSEFIAPPGTQGLFFPSQRFGSIFTRENEYLLNPDKYKYMVVNNFVKNMQQLAKTNVSKAVEQEKLIQDKILPHYQFQIIPRAKGGRLKPKNIPMYYDFSDTRINSDNTSLPFRYGGRMKNNYPVGGYISTDGGSKSSSRQLINFPIIDQNKINYKTIGDPNFTPGFEEGDELDAFNRAFDAKVQKQNKVKDAEARLNQERKRIEEGSKKIMEAANRATLGPKEYNEIFGDFKLGYGQPYCHTRNCQLARIGGRTFVNDTTVYDKEYKEDDLVNIQPGVGTFAATYLDQGYERLDENTTVEDLLPTDIAILRRDPNDPVSKGYHSIRYGGDNTWFEDHGEGYYYDKTKNRYLNNPVFFRYVGKTPQLQSAYDKAIADYKLEKEELGQTTVPRMKPMTVDRLTPTVNQMGRTYNLDTESPQLIEDQRKYVQNLGNMLNTQRMYGHGGHMYDLFTHGTYDNGGDLKPRPNSIAAKPSWYKDPIVNPSAYISGNKRRDPRMYKYGFLEGERGNVVVGGGLGFPKKGIHLSGSGVLPLSRYDIPYFKGAYDAKIMKDINKNLSLGLGANTAITGYPGENGFVMDPLKFRPNLNLKYNFRNGGNLIKRADGSYSQRGLWDNIRNKAKKNKAAGKKGQKPKPGSPMDKQIKKIERNS